MTFDLYTTLSVFIFQSSVKRVKLMGTV